MSGRGGGQAHRFVFKSESRAFVCGCGARKQKVDGVSLYAKEETPGIWTRACPPHHNHDWKWTKATKSQGSKLICSSCGTPGRLQGKKIIADVRHKGSQLFPGAGKAAAY